MDAIINGVETKTNDDFGSDNGLKIMTGPNTKSELAKGRVWRRGAVAAPVDKKMATGPVLRTTVKPVKRFHPDPIDGTNDAKTSRRITTPILNGKSDEVRRTDDEKSLQDGEGRSPTPTKQSQSPSVPATKKKRQWEQWSVVDKNYFFEAVAMYGKDFEAITSAIAQKQRKKGGEECVPRTKDQVRHLYYRTWGMISKLIDADAYPLNINRAFQELYAVINYGEIRKKLGGNLKKKGIEKLNELIREGTTSTRVKGKNFRIKTPSCKALKKMNPDYQGKEGIVDLPLVSDTRRMKIPLHVTLELLPLTVAAWNQVHSIAHNPRLRIKLPVECHLSSIFAYLEKKWKPLNSRLFRIAGKLHSAKNLPPSHKLSKHSHPSIWDGNLRIHTPPEASVNTRIMVFQVSNNKTHCIVSYALRKCSMNQEKLPEPSVKKDGKASDTEMKNQPQGQNNVDIGAERTVDGVASESEIIESCPSSEEDYDCDGMSEDTSKDDRTERDHSDDTLSHGFVTDASTSETLRTCFFLKEKDDDVCSDSREETDHMFSSTDSEAVVKKPKLLNASPNAENCADDNTNETMVLPLLCNFNKPACSQAACEAAEDDYRSAMEKTVLNVFSVSVDRKVSYLSNDPCTSHTNSPNDQSNSNNILGVPTDFADCGVRRDKNLKGGNSAEMCLVINRDKEKKQRKLSLSDKLFRADAKKHPKSVKKNFTKTTQMWSEKDCRKTTIAEIYMILGKPAIFRLCYDWLQASSEDSGHRPESDVKSDKHVPQNKKSSNMLPFSPGLLALIQAAQLTHLTEIETLSEPNSLAKAAKSMFASKAKFKHVATQCDIKVDERQSGQNTPANSSSNPHGRGISKVIPVETVVVNTIPAANGFAIPAVPSRRPRKIAANLSEPGRATMVSAETMDWLLRRERLNFRQVRKPMMEKRAGKVKPPRSMKTFSIVTRGPNKVGFLPSQPVLSCPTVVNVSSASRESPEDSTSIPSIVPSGSNGSSSLNIDKFLELGASSPTQTETVTFAANSSNLLACAAKVAGVAPPTLRKDESTDDMEKSCTESNDNVVYVNVRTSGTSEDALSFAGTAENADILSEAFGEQSSSVPLTTFTTTQTCGPVDSMPLSRPSPTVLSVSSFNNVEDGDESSLGMPWSDQEIANSAFTAEGDSLMEKLVGSESDVILSTFTNSTANGESSSNPRNRSPTLKTIVNENSYDSPPLKSVSSGFNLQIAVDKSSELPIHPWTINASSRDSVGLGGLLNTPQKALASDAEDSMDGFAVKKTQMKDCAVLINHRLETTFPVQDRAKKSNASNAVKHRNLSQDQSSTNFLAETEVDLQLQCMLNENSADYISKFQDLMRQTAGDEELSVISTDENACDGHQLMLPNVLGGVGSVGKDKNDYK